MDDGTRATIPLFPLANVVLFPKLRVPLYIFEPRYRQMTRDALDGDRRIGMVTVQPKHIDETAGNPPVFSIGCEGTIVEAESLSDGGYNIVLLGTRRFEILYEQLPDKDRLYRTAVIEGLSEGAERDRTSTESTTPAENTPVRAEEARGTIVQLLHDLLQHSDPEPPGSDPPGSKFDAELFAAYDDELFVNALAQSLSFHASEKQGLIECNNVSNRLQQLVALLQFRLAALRSGQSGGASLQ